MTAARAIAIVVTLVAACSTRKESSAFLKTADEIDYGPWTTRCGPRSDEVWPPDGHVTSTFGRRQRPPVSPTITCRISHDAGDPQVSSVDLRIDVSGAQGLRDASALHLAIRDLLEELVPRHLWPFVLMVSESSHQVTVDAYGFEIEGGFRPWGAGNCDWQLSIAVGTPGDAERAEVRADLTAVEDATPDERAQARLVDSLASPAEAVLSRVSGVDLATVTRRSGPPCETTASSDRCYRDDAHRGEAREVALVFLTSFERDVARECGRLIRSARREGGPDRRQTIARLAAIDVQVYRRLRETRRFVARFDDDELDLLRSNLQDLGRAKADQVIDALLAVPLDGEGAGSARGT